MSLHADLLSGGGGAGSGPAKRHIVRPRRLAFANSGSKGPNSHQRAQDFLRGTLECCIFPKTGHPPTDAESWRRIIRVWPKLMV